MGRPIGSLSSRRPLVTSAWVIGVRDLRWLGIVRPDLDLVRGKVLAMAFGGVGEILVPDVALDRTTCYFGGSRIWLRCPQAHCGRRVTNLYYHRGNTGCRRCLRLDYPCQRADPGERARLRAEKLRQRLGWQPGIANPTGARPRGMHNEKFERLLAIHNRLGAVAFAALAKWIGAQRR